jgi:alpha-L-rhamnosidase
MKQLVTIILCAGFLVLGESMDAVDSSVAVKKLRCEYLVNPAAVDVVKLRLSWILKSDERGQMQSGYQILVASSEENIKQNKGDLWDSGKVESNQSTGVVYQGKPLKSRMRCYWKVRVWDKDSKVSVWSEAASWTMGLLKPKDWRAEWIGYDTPTSCEEESYKLRIEGCKWIWFAEGEPRKSVPLDTRFFRRTIKIDPDKKVKQARFVLVVDDEAMLFVNGQEAGKASGWKITTILDVTDKLRTGTNTLATAVINTGDSDNPAGLAGKLLIEFETGSAATILIDRSWKVSNIKQEGWQESDFDDSGWTDAKEIATIGDEPWRMRGYGGLILPALPYMRKVFSVDRPVKRAVIYASALGLYELHINGKRIGEDYFTPGWTDYNKRVYYQSYEVTNLLATGSNAIGAILADGWYAGYLGGGLMRDHYGSKPRLLMQLEIEYADGSRKTIVTNGSWRAAYGPHLEADFYMGETYDARKEMHGWDTADFNDSKWDTVVVTDTVQAQVQSYPGVTVKKMIEIKPKKVTEPKKGVYVFDMGQNFAGWARLKVRGEPGTKVVMRFAEVLNPDGTIYTTNLRKARCTDTYILSGKGEEIWEPRFTFHGFRYVEVTGYPDEPSLDSITGIVVHSDTPVVGSFECSNPMVNQLYSNTTWGQRSNFIEVPTDCPQRDERLGWTGDAQIFIRTATYNMDVAAFFTKWLVDLEDAQTPTGAFPDVAPRKASMGSGTAAWGDAGVICPWIIYQVYGDTRVIERHYEAMKKWIEYLKKNSDGLLRPAKGYGDWVSIESETPKDVIATAYFAYSTRLLSKMAAAIGKNEDAREYETLFEQIKEAFNKAYVSEDAKIKGDTQTCYCLGLYFDLLPQSKREAAVQHLIEAIRQKNWHLSTGFVGLSYLLPVLTEAGHVDVAYRLLNNDTFPSWGYSIKNGATTIWERWDGWTEEKGFQTPGMNSFNHYAFGSVGQWLFGTVAGIETDGPGYNKIIIRPQPGGGLSYAKASYKSIHGKIVSDWKLEGQTFALNVTIPANTTATVYLPAKNAESVTEGSGAAKEAESVRFVRMEDGKAVFAVGSGDFQFVTELPQ